MPSGRIPGPIGRPGGGDWDDWHGRSGPSGGELLSTWSLGLSPAIVGRKSPQSSVSAFGVIRLQPPLFLHSNMLGEPLDYGRIYQNIVRWEGVVRHMYLDTHKPPLVTVGAGNMLPDVGAAQTLPFINAATNRPATKAEIAHAFHAVAAMPGGHGPKRYELSPSIDLPEEKVRELAITRLRTEFIPQIKKLYPGFDDFPVPAREALIDIAYNAGVGSPVRVVHGKTHEATGLYSFRRLKTAIEAGDWMAAARASHRSSSRPERNEWTRKLFERAAHLAALDDSHSHHLHLLGRRLKPPIF